MGSARAVPSPSRADHRADLSQAGTRPGRSVAAKVQPAGRLIAWPICAKMWRSSDLVVWPQPIALPSVRGWLCYFISASARAVVRFHSPQGSGIKRFVNWFAHGRSPICGCREGRIARLGRLLPTKWRPGSDGCFGLGRFVTFPTWQVQTFGARRLRRSNAKAVTAMIYRFLQPRALNPETIAWL